MEKENNDLKKENEDLKNKFEKENKEKEDMLKNNKPILNEEFTIEKSNINQNKNYNIYSIDTIQFSFDKLQKPLKEITEQGIKNEENITDLKEKTKDKLDSGKKEIRITTKTIIKKTNIIKPKFKNNLICSISNIKLDESKIFREKNNVINKVNTFSLIKTNKENETDNEIMDIRDIRDIKDIENQKLKSKINNFDSLEIKKNEDIFIKTYKNKNIGNNYIINKVSNIQLFIDKLQESKDNITENIFENNNQLINDKLQNSINEITDKNQNININVSEIGKIQKFDQIKSETDKSASYDKNLIEGDQNKKEENGEQEKITYKKRKIVKKGRKKKLKTLIIDLDNKFDLQKCFNKWNNSPNLLISNENMDDNDKNKSLNIRQIIKGKNKNQLLLNNINIKKEDLDSMNKDEKSFDKTNSNITDDNINNNINNFKDNNLNEIMPYTEILDQNETNVKKRKINLNQGIITYNKGALFNINNETNSSIEFKEDSSSLEKSDIEKSKRPKKKEIIINKKLTIITKQRKRMELEKIKSKFLEKRFLIKFWKKWKGKNKTEEEKVKGEEKVKREENTINDPNKKTIKKPFILKINKFSIKKKILELPRTKIIKQKNNEVQDKIAFLRNKIISSNKTLLTRHYFAKWKKETKSENNIIIGIDIIQRILRRYIIRYLIMSAKILKFRTILIKYAFSRNK